MAGVASRVALGPGLLRWRYGRVHRLLHRGEVSLYRTLRNTHLLLGMAQCSFVLLFGVSSIKFAHQDWFTAKPTETHLTVTVDPVEADTPRRLARLLMDREGYRGGLNKIRDTDDGFRFTIGR